MRVLVLLSGGLDSTVLAAHLLDADYDVHALGIHYGQRHARELVHARLVAKHLGVPFTYVSLPGLAALMPSALTNGQGTKVVPNRNAVLVNVAVAQAVALGIGTVALGVNANDAEDFYDCRVPFLDLLARVAEANSVGLLWPFAYMTKAEVAALGRALEAPIDLTRSCYENGNDPCGTCDACRDRAQALAVPG